MSWTLAQAVVGNTSTSGSGNITATFGSSVTAGNLLVAAASNFAAFLSGGVSDAASNTWTQIKKTPTGGGAAPCELWYAIANANTSGLVVTGNGQIDGAFAIAEFSPGGGAISINGTPASAGTTSGTTAASGNITITTPALVIGVGSCSVNALTLTAGSGFTMGYTIAQATHVGIGLEYALAVASSPTDPSFTISGSGGAWGAVGAAFLSTPIAAGAACLLAGI